jgi:carboxyl-terminal processing protease
LSSLSEGPQRPPARSADFRARRVGTLLPVRRLIAAALLLAAFASGVAVDRAAWDGGGAGASSSLTDLEEFQTFQQTWDLIHDQYVEGETVDDQALLYGASAGMVEALGDTGHSRFLTPEQADEFNAAVRGEIIGIGVQLDVRDGYPVVAAPIDGSPADQAGIKAGDVIVAVEGESTEGLEYEEIARRLRGEEGTPVNLTIQRPGQQASIEVTVVRARIKLEPVSWRMLPDGVAQIRLSQFWAGATDGLEEALKAAKAAGATAIVLDLRDNPGGLVFEAVGVASQLMPEGSVVFRERARDGGERTVRTIGRGEGQDLPLVVLINGNSASAAEIIAASLHDNGRATLIGETTFGTGTVLSPFELEDGSIALLGTGLWLTPNGEQIWKVGVEPDVEVALPLGVYASRPAEDPEVTPDELAGSPDVQLQEAHDLAVAAAA